MSSFNWNPIPKEELQLKQFTPGEYYFRVIECEEKISKSGNTYINMKLFVENLNGINFTVFDNLINHEKCIWKIHSFFESIGFPDIYEEGKLTDINFLIGKYGKLVLKKSIGSENNYLVVDKYIKKDNDEKIDIKNNTNNESKNNLLNNDENDEDLPF